jgi:hypothetical protein
MKCRSARWLVHHARRTLAIIRQNITFSLSMKTVFLALTFLGMASRWGAIAGHWSVTAGRAERIAALGGQCAKLMFQVAAILCLFHRKLVSAIGCYERTPGDTMSEKVMRRSRPNSGACRLRPEKRTDADIAGCQFGANCRDCYLKDPLDYILGFLPKRNCASEARA